MIDFTFWIVAQAKPRRYGADKGLEEPGSVRVAKKRPALANDEVAVQVHLGLPTALFNRPSLTARIEVSDTAAPAEITAETISNIQEILEEGTGLRISLVDSRRTEGEAALGENR